MYANMILKNGKVYSVNADDSVQRAEAVVVKDGKILTLCDNDEWKEYVGKETKIIDCNGGTILPGLSDSHCHPTWATSTYESCQLFDIMGYPEDTTDEVTQKYLDRLSEYMEDHKSDKLIRATGWNRAFYSGACKDSKWPTRHDLDRVCSDRPVIFESYCQHAMLVNTKALELAGVSEKNEDPRQGTMFRDDAGYPTGLFFEMEAINLIKNNLPNYDYTVEQYKSTIRRYQKELANSYGITLINDCFCTENAKIAYKELARTNELTMRVRGVYLLENCDDLSEIDDIKSKIGADNINDTFEINTIKVFLEGEFTMLEPYEAEAIEANGFPEDYKGTLFYSDDVAKTGINKAVATGLQIHIHAMGDRSVRQAVDSLIYAQQQNHSKNRNAIAHLMAIKENDIKKLGEHSIICCCQPRWMVYDSDVAEYYSFNFGKERTENFYPNKRFLDNGCVVSYGTDFPVTPPPDPFHGIQCAITRRVFPDDKNEYERYKERILGPDNSKQDCVSLRDAIKSLTYSGAYQTFLEKVTGTITPGKSAELVVLDSDIEHVADNEIYKIKPTMTIFKGEVVFEK